MRNDFSYFFATFLEFAKVVGVKVSQYFRDFFVYAGGLDEMFLVIGGDRKAMGNVDTF